MKIAAISFLILSFIALGELALSIYHNYNKFKLFGVSLNLMIAAEKYNILVLITCLIVFGIALYFYLKKQFSASSVMSVMTMIAYVVSFFI